MRKIMLGAAMAACVALGGCTAVEIEQAANTIESDIQAGTAAACGIVPTLQTITLVASVLFPGIADITSIAVAGEQAIEQDICTAAPPPASARYRALPRLRAAAAATIGVTTHGVAVQGWRAN